MKWLEYLEAILAHLEPLWNGAKHLLREGSHFAHICEKTNPACEHAIEAYAPWSIGVIITVAAVFFIAHARSH
jgi:hypothetical protein